MNKMKLLNTQKFNQFFFKKMNKKGQMTISLKVIISIVLVLIVFAVIFSIFKSMSISFPE